eukprot:354114-Chlamydomonas_euryale.AAC.1
MQLSAPACKPRRSARRRRVSAPRLSSGARTASTARTARTIAAPAVHIPESHQQPQQPSHLQLREAQAPARRRKPAASAAAAALAAAALLVAPLGEGATGPALAATAQDSLEEVTAAALEQEEAL